MFARERERVADTCLNVKFGFTYFAMPGTGRQHDPARGYVLPEFFEFSHVRGDRLFDLWGSGRALKLDFSGVCISYSHLPLSCEILS